MYHSWSPFDFGNLLPFIGYPLLYLFKSIHFKHYALTKINIRNINNTENDTHLPFFNKMNLMDEFIGSLIP